MRRPFDNVVGTIKRETELAVCLQNAKWHQNGTFAEMQSDLWVPKSNLHEDSLDTVEEAVEGEEVELFVARWWLEEQL